MKKTANLKTLYPTLWLVLSLGGTGAIFLGMPVLWLGLCLAANVFCAAGAVCGTERVPQPKRRPKISLFPEDSKEENAEEKNEAPKSEEGELFRIPTTPMLLALCAALGAGLILKSPILALVILFTWGGLGYPLALSILYRKEFGLALQSGLLSATVFSGIAGVIQVFLSSPNHTFDPQYCLNRLVEVMKAPFIQVLNQAKELIAAQEIDLSAAELSALRTVLETPEETITQMVSNIISILPGLLAVAVLALLCVIWWGTKTALKKYDGFEVMYMGRLDNYAPSKILLTVYMVFFAIQMFTKPGTVMQIASSNIILVISAVLAYSAISLIVYIINSRVRSGALRVLLTVALILFATSFGGQILVMLGLLATLIDLRKMLGGGTLK